MIEEILVINHYSRKILLRPAIVTYSCNIKYQILDIKNTYKK